MHSDGTPHGDFGVYTYLNTRLELPNRRETVLHFFSSLQKSFPDLVHFEKCDGGEFTLEGDRDDGHYRWVTLEPHRVCAGYVNPTSDVDIDSTLERVLEIAPCHLDLSPLDCETLDVLYAFELNYAGNHDEVVADALLAQSPLAGLLQLPGGRTLNFEPALTFSLDEKCKLQCRLSVETRSGGPSAVRSGQFADAPICVYFTVRQYWDRRPFATFEESYRNQRRIGQDLVDSFVVPNVIQPLAQTIAIR